MAFVSLVVASTLALPLRDCDTAPCYPTAYMDQGGRDWACRGLTFSNHSGSDFGIGGFDEMDRGRPVYAAAEGHVIQIEDGHFDRCSSGNCEGGDGYGNHIVIDHGEGQHSLYAHLRNGSIMVEVGDPIACGEAIGLVGSSGFSTGAHLHFEWRVDGESIDPYAGPCSEDESAWVVQGLHGKLPARLCAGNPVEVGEDRSRVLVEPAAGEIVATQNSRVDYCWRIENSGTRSWTTENVSAILVSGARLGQRGNINLSETVLSGASTELCAQLTATGEVGERLRSSWRMARAGSVFGSILVVRIDVVRSDVVDEPDAGPRPNDVGVDVTTADAGARDSADAGGLEDVHSGCDCVTTTPVELSLAAVLLLAYRRRYRAGTLN